MKNTVHAISCTWAFKTIDWFFKTAFIIPKVVYTYVYSKDGTLNGFTDFTLSHFDPKAGIDIFQKLKIFLKVVIFFNCMFKK